MTRISRCIHLDWFKLIVMTFCIVWGCNKNSAQKILNNIILRGIATCSLIKTDIGLARSAEESSQYKHSGWKEKNRDANGSFLACVRNIQSDNWYHGFQLDNYHFELWKRGWYVTNWVSKTTKFVEQSFSVLVSYIIVLILYSTEYNKLRRLSPLEPPTVNYTWICSKA